MPITKTIELFQYGELTDKAKETARDWWLSCRDESDFSCVIEDFAEIAELMGITLDTNYVKLMSGKTRSDPAVSYSVGYCQSDFAAFDGHYRYVPGAAAKVKAYAPQDSALHGIADALQAVQARNFYKLQASVKYHHYYGQQVEVTHADDEYRSIKPEDFTDVKEAMRDLSQWLYRQLQQQDEYLSSEEAIADAMEANEYTFRDDGKRED